MLGGALFAVLFVVAHLVQPEVDPSWQPPSELALGTAGWVMIAAFLALGIGCAALCVVLANQVTTWPGRIGVIAVAIAAVGCLIGGAFTADPVTTPPGEATLTGAIHSLGPVLLDGIPVAAVLLAISLPRHSAHWRRARPVLIAGAACTVGAALLLTVSMGVFMSETGQLGPDVPIGWQGRFLLLAVAAWVVTVAGLALSIHRRARAGAAGAAEVSARSTLATGASR